MSNYACAIVFIRQDVLCCPVYLSINFGFLLQGFTMEPNHFSWLHTEVVQMLVNFKYGDPLSTQLMLILRSEL